MRGGENSPSFLTSLGFTTHFAVTLISEVNLCNESNPVEIHPLHHQPYKLETRRIVHKMTVRGGIAVRRKERKGAEKQEDGGTRKGRGEKGEGKGEGEKKSLGGIISPSAE